MQPLWLTGLQLLAAVDEPPRPGDALIAADGVLLACGLQAAAQASGLGLAPLPAPGMLLAPALVDAHSVLEDPFQGCAETLASLAAAAAAGGYGTVALLPWAISWRDRPERLQLSWPEPLRLCLWGSFSRAGQDETLAPHAEQLAAGAVGVAGSAELPPLPLLERGLCLNEFAGRPLLLAPRQEGLCAGGFVRESAAALRAGWPIDPPISEQLPLQLLAGLQQHHPQLPLLLMNLSTAGGVGLLRDWPAERRAAATVSWWHLLADAEGLAPTAEGLLLQPSLGAAADREALIAGLEEGLITAVALHHQALDREEQLLPLDQRRAGVAGHGGPVLPRLWHELVRQRGWTVEQLWRVLCWQPARLLGLEPEGLAAGGRRWLLFDPMAAPAGRAGPSLAANHPGPDPALAGAIRACGLTAADQWRLPAPGCLSG
jgi:dihydroorotase